MCRVYRGEPEVITEAPAPVAAPDFASRVSFQMMLEHVVPPRRPPEGHAGCLWLVFGSMAIMLIVLGVELGKESPGGGWVVAPLVVVIVAICAAVHFSFRRKLNAHETAHGQAMAMATRMLAGRGARGDSEHELRRLADIITSTSEPQPGGSTWIFVWWEG